MDAKFCYSCIQILVVTLVVANGEVQICFNTAPLAVTNSQSLAKTEISQLTTEAKTEITEALTAWFNETTYNFTILPVNFSHPAITMTGEITNGTVVIQEKALKLFTIDPDGFELFNLTFSSISLKGWYDLNGYVGANRLFDIYGKGQLSLELLDFSIAFLVNLNITETALCIPILSRVYVADYWNNFENMMNGDVDLEPLINGAFQYIVPDAIRIIYREMVDEYVDPYIQKAIDDALQGNGLTSFSSLLQAMALNKANVNAIY